MVFEIRDGAAVAEAAFAFAVIDLDLAPYDVEVFDAVGRVCSGRFERLTDACRAARAWLREADRWPSE